MTPAASAADRLAATRDAIERGLRLVEVLRPDVPGEVAVTDELNLSQVSCVVQGAVLTGALDPLRAAATAGHRLSARVSEDGSDLTVNWLPGGRVSVEVTGDPGNLVGQREVEQFSRAIDRDDGIAALAILASAELTFELVIRAPTGQAGWVRSAALLAGRLSDGGWGSVLAQLAGWAGQHRAVVLVQDGADGLLCTPGLLLAGPDAELTEASSVRNIHTIQAYRDRAGFSARSDIFTPAELVGAEATTGPLATLAEPLANASRAAAWYWLADSVELGPDHVRVRFDGVSSVEFDMLPYGSGPPVAELGLAEWAMATGEPARADAVQQAITFAVRGVTDLAGAAAPVLRTARSLYELAGRGLISEALAARRSARESAVAAADAAGSTAREVAAKSVERTAALVIAAAAALFANTRQFLTDSTSYIILIALAAIAGAALLVAWRVDTKSGYTLLDAFDTDVQLYRDTLSDDDIAAVKELSVLSAAREDLGRARVTACVIYGVVIIAVLVGGGMIIVQNGNRPVGPGPSSTPSATAQVSGTTQPTVPGQTSGTAHLTPTSRP